MGKIIDVREVQKELDQAARDARHGPPDVRAGRFVHADARVAPTGGSKNGRAAAARSRPGSGANSVPGRKPNQGR